MSVKEKIRDWVKRNPHGYLQNSYKQIASQIGVAPGSVDKYLVDIIAERDNCLPSEVMEKRVAAGYKRSPRRISDQTRAEIRQLHNEGHEVVDIRYITGYSLYIIKKVIREISEGTTA